MRAFTAAAAPRQIWRTLLDPSLPSPRTEILHNLNQACGRGKMAGTATLAQGDTVILHCR